MQTVSLSKIIMIVPKLPPAIDGVGDYSLMLAQQLKRHGGIKTTFIVTDPDWCGPAIVAGFPVHVLAARSADALHQILTRLTDAMTTVFLQFSGYGYARHGLCTWLVKALKQWKARRSDAKLLIMFHELFVQPGHLLSKNFWIHQLQKSIVADLVNLSDNLITNADVHVVGLNALGYHQEILKLPVPSNIGEPRPLPLMHDRKNQLVLFGQEGTRRRAYQNQLSSLELICEQLCITTIVDIGTPIPLEFQQIGAARIVQMGELSETQISQILAESKVAFLDYGDSRHLAKSSVFAAYCAHGVVPIVAQASPMVLDGLRAGVNYLAFDAVRDRLCDFTNLQDVADAAHAWYCDHALSIQTQAIMAKVKALVPCTISL